VKEQIKKRVPKEEFEAKIDDLVDSRAITNKTGRWAVEEYSKQQKSS
jgi:hypothetical protein